MIVMMLFGIFVGVVCGIILCGRKNIPVEKTEEYCTKEFLPPFLEEVYVKRSGQDIIFTALMGQTGYKREVKWIVTGGPHKGRELAIYKDDIWWR